MDLYHILILVGRQVLTHLGEAGNWSLYDAQMEADRDICHLLLRLLQFLSSFKDTKITSNGKNLLVSIYLLTQQRNRFFLTCNQEK